MSDDRLLSALEGLADQWRQQGAPLASLLAPGATTDHIRRVWAGVEVPEEAEVLWSWHNGTTIPGYEGQTTESAMGPGPYALMSCEQARSRYDDLLREYGQSVCPDEPALADIYWHADSLPIFAQVFAMGVVYLRNTTPGVFVQTYVWEGFNEPQASSLAEVVELWQALIADGYYTWTGSGWQSDFLSLPSELRNSFALFV